MPEESHDIWGRKIPTTPSEIAYAKAKVALCTVLKDAYAAGVDTHELVLDVWSDALVHTDGGTAYAKRLHELVAGHEQRMLATVQAAAAIIEAAKPDRD
jgi:hypothetical protein